MNREQAESLLAVPLRATIARRNSYRLLLIVAWLFSQSSLTASYQELMTQIKRQEEAQAYTNWITQQPTDKFKAFLETPTDSSPNKFLLSLAEKGDPRACFFLALHHQNGKDIAQDEDKAFEYCKKSADQMFIPAIFLLGEYYQNGIGTSLDKNRAFQLFKQAAEANYPPALHNLALCYTTGEGVRQDYQKAFALYKKSADFGLSQSMNNLAICYKNGLGTKVDLDLGLSWGRKAADSGLPTAWYTIALILYENKDLLPAFEAFNKSAKAGDPCGCATLTMFYIDYKYLKGSKEKPENDKRVMAYLTALSKDITEADMYRMSKQSLESGFLLANEALGYCYLFGMGTEVDYQKSYLHLGVALALRSSGDLLQNLNYTGTFLTSNEKIEVQNKIQDYLKKNCSRDQISGYMLPTAP